jgi:3',5'-cyclic AMP phosphodiesterase CpdA
MRWDEKKGVSRRQMVRAAVAAGAAGAGLIASDAIAADSPAARPFRVAHLTDMHVQPERRAIDGYTAALHSLESLDPRPDLLVTGGDHVMDTTEQLLDRAKVVWESFDKAQSQTKLPWRPLLGNHDIFGWGKPEVDEKTVGYGRAMALDQLKLQRPYYSFDAGGWKFILLDSMSRRDNSYLGDLGPEQTEWLRGELQATPTTTPIVIFSHIPILAVCVFFDGKERLVEKGWSIPDSWMHRDARELLDLFATRNVRLLVSGHIHLVDRADYRGMTFICDGAVSGNWWKGPRYQFPEGYGLLDLYPDGRFEHRYVTYGWIADKA